MNFDLPPEIDKEVLSGLKSKFASFKSVKTAEDLESLCEGSEILKEMLQEVFDQCLKYTETVIEFNKILQEVEGDSGTMETLNRIDSIRKGTHDSTISTINAFSRMLAKEGRDNSWMADVSQSRAAYTRFALTLTFSRISNT